MTSPTTAQPALLVIDGFSLAFRAFYGLPPTIKLPDGQPINAVFGFVSLLFDAIDKINPTHVTVCFDRPEPTFRKKIYPDYKAHRSPPPEEFVTQIPLLKSCVESLGLTILEKPGFEADDILGTLARLGHEQQFETALMTGDQDCFQLVGEHVSVLMSRKGVSDLFKYTPEAVIEKCQVTPDQIIDYKALKGDASDNIPGVRGIGDKTATALLSQYQTLDGIYEHLSEITSKSVKTKLETGKEMAYISQKLATIDQHVPIDLPFEKFEYTRDWPTVMSVFKQYHFNRLITKYQSKLEGADDDQPLETPDTKAPDGTYTTLESVSELKAILPQLKSGFAIDLETTSLTVHDAQIVGIALSWESKKAVYIPLNKSLESDATQGLALFDQFESTQQARKVPPLLAALAPLLEDASIPKITHNGKYEWHVFQNYDIAFSGIAFDTMLAAYLLYPGERVGLKDLVHRTYGITMTTFESLVGKGKAQIPFADIPIDQATHYAAADADFTFRLYETLKANLAEEKLLSVLTDIELPTQAVLGQMEREGVCVNRAYLADLEKTFDERAMALSTEIKQISGGDFNLNSTQQLGVVLYEQMGLPILKKNKTGPSTDSSVLTKLAVDHPIAEKILNYRSLEKLQSTYVRSLPGLIHPKTNRIHTSFNQTVAATGRLSSNNPNLQNIPIRTEEGRLIRRAFIPSHPENFLLSADYSQIELRVLAHLSEDPNLVQAFQNGEDIHTATAAIINHCEIADVTKEQRYRAKAVNFGILYGQSAFGLSETIGTSRKESKEIITAYFEKFPTIKTLIDETIEGAKETGRVWTEFGRMRPVPQIFEKNHMRRQFGERMAVNTRMQGTAADIMKLAMCQVATAMAGQNLRSKMVVQVHDELVFDVVPEEKDLLMALVEDKMTHVTDLKVPLDIDMAIGKNWQEVS